MKVLHITNNYPTKNFPIYGIFVKEQIDSLSSLNVENEVFFIDGRDKGKKAYLMAIKELRHKLKKEKYDILHCHHVLSAVVLLLTFQFFKFKMIISYQNHPQKEGGKLMFKIIYYLFDSIINKSLGPINNKKKVRYLPNGVNTIFFKPYNKKYCRKKLNLDIEKIYLLFMDSNIKKRSQKRVDRFLKVLEILKRNYDLSNIVPLILTNIKRELIPYYINASDLYLLTSDFEGSPNAVKECMACNTSVVSTNVGNVIELIGNLKGYYVVDTFDPHILATYVIKAIDEKEQILGRERLVELGLDINTVSKIIVNIYKNIIDK